VNQAGLGLSSYDLRLGDGCAGDFDRETFKKQRKKLPGGLIYSCHLVPDLMQSGIVTHSANHECEAISEGPEGRDGRALSGEAERQRALGW
jgi:hypothetical protein